MDPKFKQHLEDSNSVLVYKKVGGASLQQQGLSALKFSPAPQMHSEIMPAIDPGNSRPFLKVQQQGLQERISKLQAKNNHRLGISGKNLDIQIQKNDQALQSKNGQNSDLNSALKKEKFYSKNLKKKDKLDGYDQQVLTIKDDKNGIKIDIQPRLKVRKDRVSF